MMEERQRELEQAGADVAQAIDEAMGHWRTERLLTRAEMLRHAYDERIVDRELEPAAGLSLRDLFGIEVFAILKAFDEARDRYAAEAAAYLGEDLIGCIKQLDLGAAVRDRIYAEHGEVRDELLAQLSQAADLEIERRSESH